MPRGVSSHSRHIQSGTIARRKRAVQCRRIFPNLLCPRNIRVLWTRHVTNVSDIYTGHAPLCMLNHECGSPIYRFHPVMDPSPFGNSWDVEIIENGLSYSSYRLVRLTPRTYPCFKASFTRTFPPWHRQWQTTPCRTFSKTKAGASPALSLLTWTIGCASVTAALHETSLIRRTWSTTQRLYTGRQYPCWLSTLVQITSLVQSVSV